MKKLNESVTIITGASSEIGAASSMKIAYITYNGALKYSSANGFNENEDLLPMLRNKGLDISANMG
ncbi:NAD(P)-dependent dehydrogenase (short-subunit alcohol dehydrogenase family) [Pedobacter sp. W3I1]|uniref:hypothetical protein n=1 Tax=Pedobacter sp. W3I1 TaxID=3042291 RepID=UPI0027889107|nr:hypothetical protein [Pedobacter sp. W3I1]MDQ0638432.1 NAD(P)-dependent dehydrogenase (short-subunit alcohol dehydrogenase family) [Pedobacter sp. W3I1]